MPTSSALLIKELGVNQIIYKINYRIMIEIERKLKMVKNYILFLSQTYWRSYIRINKKNRNCYVNWEKIIIQNLHWKC